MKIEVLPIGSVWFGTEQIAVCPWNTQGGYYTLAQIRACARGLGYSKFAGSGEVDNFAKEMFRKECRRKDAPVSRLLCLKHRGKIRRSVSRVTLARSEILHVPTLNMDPHPHHPKRYDWVELPISKIGGKIFISPYEFVVFSK